MHQRYADVKGAISIATKAYEHARQAKDEYWIHRARCDLSLYYMIQSDYSKALAHGQAALDYFTDKLDLKGLSAALYNLGSVHYKTDEYHLGLKYLLDCMEILNKLHDEVNQSRVLKAIGTIYEYFGDLESAKEVYKKSIMLSSKNADAIGESNALNPISGIYLKEGKIAKARQVAERSIALKKQTGDVRGMGFALHALGKIQLKERAYEQAFESFNESYQLHHQSGESIGQTMALEKLGKLFLLKKDYKQAHHYLQLALEGANQNRYLLILYKVYYHLYVIAKEKGDFAQALEYHELYHNYFEQVVSGDTNSLIKSLKSAAQMEMLERETEIQRIKNKEIEAKNQELDTFVYKASHDLRGPISSLLGLNSIIERDVTDPKALEYFGFYKEQTEWLHHIVTELINLTRIKKWKVRHDPINFADLIERCIRQYQFLPNYDQIDFRVELPEELLYLSDELTITTIIQNLVENAVKYANVNQAVCWVKISVAKEEGRLLIFVEDNGIGIKEEYQPRIFEMFFRANDSGEGSGLGLYILKNAVDKLQGEITLRSAYGKGSLFCIELPLNQTETPAPELQSNP